MNKTAKTILIIVLAVVLLGGGVFVGINWNSWFGDEKKPTVDVDDNAEDWKGEKEGYTGKKNTDSIDIPGYGSLTLKANDTEQSVNLNNPEQNTCYFRMTLLLSDGKELWQSGYVEPGKGLYNITLKQALSAGTYENAVLKYECFAMDEEQTPLNGSEINLTLNVIE